MNFSDLNIGDRVMLNWEMRHIIDQGPPFYDGIAGTVVDFRDMDVGVRWDFDEPSGYCHNCGNACERGYGWYVPLDALLPDALLPLQSPVSGDDILSLLRGEGSE